MLSRLSGARAVSRTWWVWAGVALLAYAAATFTIAEADLWGHLRFGLDLLRDRHLSSVDPYSFTQDRPWVNHEWLSELAMAIAYRIGGVAGLALLKGTMVFATALIVWGALRDVRLGVRVALMVLMYVGTVHATSSIRPQVWTFLFVAVLARVLSEDRTRRYLPALFAVWVNAHGGWIVGLAILGVWVAIEALDDWRTAERGRSGDGVGTELGRSQLRPSSVPTPSPLRPRSVPLVAACALATLVNPYGIGLWVFIRDTVGFSRDIREWQPLFANPVDVWAPWAIAVGGLLFLAPVPHRHRPPALAVSAMLAYASFRVMRINSLFVITALIVMAPALARRAPARLITLPARRPPGEAVAAAFLFAVCLAGAGWILHRTTACVRIAGSWAPSPVPMRLLQAAPAGRLVPYFDWGQYAIWHLGPRIKVAMDGRRETVYSEQRLGEYRGVVEGSEAGLRQLAEWAPEYVWLPSTSAGTRRWLEGRGYRVLWEDERAFLAAAPEAPWLPASSGLMVFPNCFPG